MRSPCLAMLTAIRKLQIKLMWYNTAKRRAQYQPETPDSLSKVEGRPNTISRWRRTTLWNETHQTLVDAQFTQRNFSHLSPLPFQQNVTQQQYYAKHRFPQSQLQQHHPLSTQSLCRAFLCKLHHRVPTLSPAKRNLQLPAQEKSGHP